MTQEFDLVVIGTGTAAATVAGRCRKAGWSVAIIDELPFGGTCALRGCDPKKMLRRGPEIIDAASRLDGKGIVPDGLHIDWPALMAFKRSFTDPIPEKREKSFVDGGMATFHGAARFVDRNTVAVGADRLRGRHVVTRPIPRADAILEFAIHGVKYAFPAERGEPTRGIPTAFAAPVFQNRIAISQDLPPVWPYSKGSIRGYALSPIYRAAPIAATNDPILYDLLAALDGIREGRARERELSAQILNSLIK